MMWSRMLVRRWQTFWIVAKYFGTSKHIDSSRTLDETFIPVIRPQ